MIRTSYSSCEHCVRSDILQLHGIRGLQTASLGDISGNEDRTIPTVKNISNAQFARSWHRLFFAGPLCMTSLKENFMMLQDMLFNCSCPRQRSFYRDNIFSQMDCSSTSSTNQQRQQRAIPSRCHQTLAAVAGMTVGHSEAADLGHIAFAAAGHTAVAGVDNTVVEFEEIDAHWGSWTVDTSDMAPSKMQVGVHPASLALPNIQEACRLHPQLEACLVDTADKTSYNDEKHCQSR